MDISPKNPVRNGWLKPFENKIGKRTGYYFSIPQVRAIFSFRICRYCDPGVGAIAAPPCFFISFRACTKQGVNETEPTIIS